MVLGGQNFPLTFPTLGNKLVTDSLKIPQVDRFTILNWSYARKNVQILGPKNEGFKTGVDILREIFIISIKF